MSRLHKFAKELEDLCNEYEIKLVGTREETIDIKPTKVKQKLDLAVYNWGDTIYVELVNVGEIK